MKVKDTTFLQKKRIVILLGIFLTTLLVLVYYQQIYQRLPEQQESVNEGVPQEERNSTEQNDWLTKTPKKKERFFVKEYDNASYFLEWEAYEYNDDIEPEEKNTTIFNANATAPLTLVEIRNNNTKVYEQEGVKLSNGSGKGDLIKIVDDKDIKNIQVIIGRSGSSAQLPVQINLLTKKSQAHVPKLTSPSQSKQKVTEKSYLKIIVWQQRIC
jgi:hypothetical protein